MKRALLAVVFVVVLFANTNAQSGTLTFNASNRTNIGAIVSDGMYSTDIPGIKLDIFAAMTASDASNRKSTGSFVFFNVLTESMTLKSNIIVPIDLTYGDQTKDENNLPRLLVIKSNDGSQFYFKSIYVADYIASNSPIKFEGFRDGVSTGSVILEINKITFEESFTSDFGLSPTIFSNVDEVRISNQMDGDMYYGIYAGFNNISIETAISAPVVLTSSATSVTSSGAILNGSVTANSGNATVQFAMGYTTGYGTTLIPVQSPVSGTTATAVSYTVSGLAPNTIYHYRVAGSNLLGTINGNDVTFTTLATFSTVTTNSVTTYNATSAIFGGNAISDGGASVTERGVVYSSSSVTPIIGAVGVTKEINGLGTGSFSESISGLAANTTYYVRAYAINSIGISYGSVVSFKTNTVTGFETPAAIKLAIYPNPATDGFTIDVDNKEAILYIYDITGKLVFTQQVVNSTYVNVENLKSGLYIVKVNGQNLKLIKK